MATKPIFVFVDVKERPKQNSMAIKRQRLIEGLTKQSAEVTRFAAGHWSPRIWFWADDSGKFFIEVPYAKKPFPISEGRSAILCRSLDELAEKIEQLKVMVGFAEPDQQIEATSDAIHGRFKKLNWAKTS